MSRVALSTGPWPLRTFAKWDNLMSTPIIKVFPPLQTDPDSDQTLGPVRAALERGDTKMRLMGLLKSYEARALVITPEYLPMREEDIKRSIVFHVLIDSTDVSSFSLAKLTTGIGELLGVEGLWLV